jgi:hypothetical protein
MIVVLDTGVLGMLCHRGDHEPMTSCRNWFLQVVQDGHTIAVPEIADYELRRELLRINKRAAVATLDRMVAESRYLPITTADMHQASSLWAATRRRGRVTAHAHALDGDVILAAQVLSLEKLGERCVVATTNVGHLTWFVDARAWETIDPDALS